MSTPIKRGLQKKIHHFYRDTYTDYPCSHNQDIGIIVLSAQSGRKKVMADTRPDPFIAVSHYAHAKAGPTDQDPTLVFTPGYSLCYFMGYHRIICGVPVEYPYICDLPLGQALKMGLASLL